MLEDLYTGALRGINAPVDGEHEWDFLMSQWPDNSVRFYIESSVQKGPQWVLEETLGPFGFHMTRNIVSGERLTQRNDLGLIGFSLVDPSQRKCTITEGVSDYFAVKMLCPDDNVLGFTSLAGSSKARALVLSLFDQITYCADNDEAGLSAGIRVKSFFESYAKNCRIFTAPSPYKDMAQAVMSVAKRDALLV